MTVKDGLEAIHRCPLALSNRLASAPLRLSQANCAVGRKRPRADISRKVAGDGQECETEASTKNSDRDASEEVEGEDEESEEGSEAEQEELGFFESVGSEEETTETEGPEKALIVTVAAAEKLLEGGEYKQCVRFLRSCFRHVIVPEMARGDVSVKRSKVDGRKGQRADGVASRRDGSKLQTMKDRAAFKFAEEMNEHMLALFSFGLEKLSTAATSTGATKPSHITHSDKAMQGFWIDFVVMLSTVGSRNPFARHAILALGSLPSNAILLSLYRHPTLVPRFMSKFLEVLFKIHDKNALSEALNILSELLVNGTKLHRGDKKKAMRHTLVSRTLKQVLFGLSVACSKRVGPAALAALRQIISSLAATIRQCQDFAGPAVFDAFFAALRRLVIAAARLGRTNDSHRITEAVQQKLRETCFSWNSLLTSHLVISIIVLEQTSERKPASELGRFALSVQAEGWATLLLGLTRQAMHRQSAVPLPFVYKCCANLLALQKATRQHVPMGILLTSLAYLSLSLARKGGEVALCTAGARERTKKSSTKLVKDFDIDGCLSLESEQVGQVRVVESLFARFLSHITDYLALLAQHPSFPETSYILCVHLKKLAKLPQLESQSYKLKLKDLVTVSEQTAVQISALRASLDLNSLPPLLDVFDSKTTSKMPLLRHKASQPPTGLFYAIQGSEKC